MLSNIIMSRPDYEFPQRLHAEIVNMVEKTANGHGKSDFGEIDICKSIYCLLWAEYGKKEYFKK